MEVISRTQASSLGKLTDDYKGKNIDHDDYVFKL